MIESVVLGNIIVALWMIPVPVQYVSDVDGLVTQRHWIQVVYGMCQSKKVKETTKVT